METIDKILSLAMMEAS